MPSHALPRRYCQSECTVTIFLSTLYNLARHRAATAVAVRNGDRVGSRPVNGEHPIAVLQHRSNFKTINLVNDDLPLVAGIATPAKDLITQPLRVGVPKAPPVASVQLEGGKFVIDPVVLKAMTSVS